ncbi:MAG TPA: diaminopimelate epimerase [Candidatus Tumulicola sp.]|nr:diaminopimelate epimerase [Candidatus Tumulicola sp.]
MHGACNDFVVIDRRSQRVESLNEFARWACNRREGIGADGLIAIEKTASSGLAMRTLNADGSEAEMCGNGIRCAARWLDEAGEGDRLEFATPAGIVRTQVVVRRPEYVVKVEMGVPKILTVDSGDAVLVDMGNPHVVLFREDVDGFDLPAAAQRFARDPALPQGANVHVASVEGGGRLRVRHWERGVGETPACGTGAVACAAAAIAEDRATAPVDVLVPGGRLIVEWDGAGRATLTGPAVRVFDTEVPAAPFAER